MILGQFVFVALERLVQVTLNIRHKIKTCGVSDVDRFDRHLKFNCTQLKFVLQSLGRDLIANNQSNNPFIRVDEV